MHQQRPLTAIPRRLMMAHRPKTNVYMLDELIQLYSYAEDLDTYEHAAKELSTFLAGPVSLTDSSSHHSAGSDFLTESDERLQGCEGDLLDDVRHSIIPPPPLNKNTQRLLFRT